MSSSVAKGQADFALQFLQNIANSDGPVVYSPFSISVALAMASLGAKGNTKTQINNALASGWLNEFTDFLL